MELSKIYADQENAQQLLIQNQDSLDIKSGDLVDIILLNNLK